jgi:hypothetical protein
MERMILATKEFVERFASDKQKASYAKTGKLQRDVRDAIITTAKTEWNNVDIIKNPNGRGNAFELTGKKAEVLDRKELLNYHNVGQGQLPFKHLLEQLVYAYLVSDNGKHNVTYKVLAHQTGIMSDTIFYASKNATVEEKKNYYRNHVAGTELAKNGFKVFWDVINVESQALIRYVKSVVNDMQKKQIIRYMDVVNAVTLENRKEVHNPIDAVKAYHIDMVKKQLREKHNVTHRDIRFKKKSPAVVAYKKAEYKYLQSLGYEYVYNAIIIYINATDREINEYMQTDLMQDFMEKYILHSYDKAQNRENDRIDKLIKELGGKRKPAHAETYTDKYSETLSLIQNIDVKREEKIA